MELLHDELTSEASSTMRELVGVHCSGTYLYLYCVKPGISTMSAQSACIVELTLGVSEKLSI